MQGLGKGKGGSIRQKPKERKEYGVQALINLRKALDPNQMLIPKAVFERTLRLGIFISFQYFYHFYHFSPFSPFSPFSLVSLLSRPHPISREVLTAAVRKGRMSARQKTHGYQLEAAGVSALQVKQGRSLLTYLKVEKVPSQEISSLIFRKIVKVLSEATMVRLFEQLLKYSNHAKRVTIQIEDVKLSW